MLLKGLGNAWEFPVVLGSLELKHVTTGSIGDDTGNNHLHRLKIGPNLDVLSFTLCSRGNGPLFIAFVLKNLPPHILLFNLKTYFVQKYSILPHSPIMLFKYTGDPEENGSYVS